MNIISLFSGAGGLDLGFEQAGFNPVLAYDVKESAVATYNFNRGASIARTKDLTLLEPDEIRTQIHSLKLKSKVRGIVGGPPCQYFSNGNRVYRRADDPRRTLPITYAKVLHQLNEEFQLDFFILENVSGLAKPAHQEDFAALLNLFDQAGFNVFYTILDAYNFGVPQHRQRVFIVGWNKLLYPNRVYEFPVGRPSGLTVKHIISGLGEPRFYEPNLNPEDFPEHPNHWTMQPNSEKFKSPPPPDLKRTTRSFRRLLWNEPSYTVAYGHNEIHIHPNGHRRLSIYEAMLLQAFPSGTSGYRLLGNFSEQVSLVSDAVPPPLAKALAKSFIRFMKHN